jgi:uncharacterized oligopeptide transporter (OPT) family protein
MSEHDGQHPRTLASETFILLIVLCVLGAIIGIQLLTTLGITANTAIIGALVAMILARVPLQFFRRFRSIHVQNLAQSAISAATFGAANSLLMPIGVPFVMGRLDLILPMFVGVSIAMLLDGFMLYRMYDTKVFPASGAWPPGVAAAEAIKAGDSGGKQAVLLLIGTVVGALGAFFKIPMSAFGTAFIGNIWALSMFGIGLLSSGYSQSVLGMNLNKMYIPHGVMIGAGIVALAQVVCLIYRREKPAAGEVQVTRGEEVIKNTVLFGLVAYVLIAALIAFIGGLTSEMSASMLICFVFYAAFAAFAHELIVGIAAMHSGWFPAFAVALITLIGGIMIGFPAPALALLCGFSAATGPAFADMGYDLKAGFILRGYGKNFAFELDGRRQQFIAATMAFVIAIPVVWLTYDGYFSNGLLPPVAKVYASTIAAGVAADVARPLLLWAVPGALIQLIGGPRRQLGVLLATGLLVANPMAGWAVLTGITIRIILTRRYGEEIRGQIEVFAAGCITGDALFNFFNSLFKSASVPKE